LTFNEDKLAAISGLARRACQNMRDIYLAGLFKNDLARGLMWKRADKAVLRKPKKYRAPSCSWASLDGRVCWAISSRNVPLFDVLHLPSASSGSNNTKLEPSANLLVLSGPLIATTDIAPGPGTVYGSYFAMADFDSTVPDFSSMVTLRFDLKARSCLEHYQALPVCINEGNTDRLPKEIVGILLGESQERRIFQRVGVFSFEDREIWSREFGNVQPSTVKII
jgi:hypothetical protein